jgi:hypothetical protein
MLTWIYIMMLMLAGSFVLQLVPLLFYREAVILINLVILAGSYFILKRNRMIDLRANMLFMAGLVVINSLTDLGMMSYSMSWIAFAALVIWSMMGGGRR